MKDKQYDIQIECGADYNSQIILKDPSESPVDLSNAVVTAQLREFPESRDYIPFIATHYGESGIINLHIPHRVTEHIGYTRGVYDVFVETETSKDRVMWGKVLICPSVTKGEE